MPSRCTSSNRAQDREPSITQTNSSGGSSETDVSELASIATGSSPAIPHTAATPLGKHPNARRSWA